MVMSNILVSAEAKDGKASDLLKWEIKHLFMLNRS